ncbi:hypothetical protein CGRA01v4_10254 [Colletotrichum graminicola]|nr:hypothetical protein CGRA01v4_10254 [Colletotrichum graminicola]
MCFWAAGLSLRTAFWPTSMDSGVDGGGGGGGGGGGSVNTLPQVTGGGLAPSLYFVSFLFDFFGFLVSRENALLTSIGPSGSILSSCLDHVCLFFVPFFIFFICYSSLLSFSRR